MLLTYDPKTHQHLVSINNKSNVMEWSAQFPDPNLIENRWADIKKYSF